MRRFGIVLLATTAIAIMMVISSAGIALDYVQGQQCVSAVDGCSIYAPSGGGACGTGNANSNCQVRNPNNPTQFISQTCAKCTGDETGNICVAWTGPYFSIPPTCSVADLPDVDCGQSFNGICTPTNVPGSSPPQMVCVCTAQGNANGDCSFSACSNPQ